MARVSPVVFALLAALVPACFSSETAKPPEVKWAELKSPADYNILNGKMTKEVYAGWLARAEKDEPIACDIVAIANYLGCMGKSDLAEVRKWLGKGKDLGSPVAILFMAVLTSRGELRGRHGLNQPELLPKLGVWCNDKHPPTVSWRTARDIASPCRRTTRPR